MRWRPFEPVLAGPSGDPGRVPGHSRQSSRFVERLASCMSALLLVLVAYRLAGESGRATLAASTVLATTLFTDLRLRFTTSPAALLASAAGELSGEPALADQEGKLDRRNETHLLFL